MISLLKLILSSFKQNMFFAKANFRFLKLQTSFSLKKVFSTVLFLKIYVQYINKRKFLSIQDISKPKLYEKFFVR